MSNLPTHAVHIYDGDAMLREFLGAIAVDLARLEALGAMSTAHGYGIVRLVRSSQVMWGVLT